MSPTPTIIARPLLLLARCGLTKARRAKIPPSPWLLARMIRIAYLMEIMTISDQKISDTIPMTASGAIAAVGLAAFVAICKV